jgi:hypothetical protein
VAAYTEQPSNEASETHQTAAARYAELEPVRQPFLDRARYASTLTIPGLIPPDGQTGATTLTQPFQSIGADGVNNLTAKILLALFPAGQGFFRIALDDFTVEKLKARAKQQGTDADDARAAYEEALGKVERAVVNRMEQRGNRKVRHEAVQHAIVGGNALVFVKPDGGEKFFPLWQYVVKRDLDGDVLEIIVKECIDRKAAPKTVKAMLKEDPSVPKGSASEKNVDIYTWVQRADNGSWSIHQEVEGSIIPGSKGSYPKDRSPWIPLRWRMVSSEDYGRGRVEEYLGDMVSAEWSQKAIVEFGVQASKVHWLVDPNGATDKDNVAKKPNGAVYDGDVEAGRAKNVGVLMLEKGQDFGILAKVFDDIKQRLERAFLSATAVQRNAERVTAEEIRAMINELEQGLGGVYVLWADEFQRPLAVVHLHKMMASGDLPMLPKDLVNIQIVTGLDGLSRQSDWQKLQSLTQNVSAVFGPEAAAEYFKVGGYITRGGAALGLDIKDLVHTDQEISDQRQQAAQQETMQKLAPAGIKAATDIATKAAPQTNQ